MASVIKLSKDKLEECRNVFNANDKYKNGFISCSKLSLIYRSLGAYIPQEDLEEFIGNKKEIKFEKLGSKFCSKNKDILISFSIF